MSWILFASTHSVLLLGEAWAAYLAVSGLGQLLLGPLPDAFDRKRMLTALDAVRGGLLLAFSLYLLGRSAGSPGAAFAVVGVFLLMGVLGLPYRPGTSALLPAVLPRSDVRRGNVWLQGGIEAMYLVGPAAGGLFITRFGAAPALGLDAATFLASAGLIGLVRASANRARRVATMPQYLAALGDGLRAFASSTPLLALTALDLVHDAVDAFFVVLLVPLVRTVLHGDASAVGTLEACASLGVVAASPWLQPLARRRPRGFLVGAPLFVLATGLIAAVPALSWALGTQLAAGAASSAVDVEVETGYQMTVPTALLGRSLMLRSAFGYFASAGGALLCAPLSLRLGIPHAFMLAGGLGIALLVWPTLCLAGRDGRARQGVAHKP